MIGQIWGERVVIWSEVLLKAWLMPGSLMSGSELRQELAKPASKAC